MRRAGVTVRRGTDVISATPGGEQSRATVVTDDGTDDADLFIGADGARSTVRATVDPEHPDARYAGVLLWRTLVAESALPPEVALPADGEPSREMYAGPYRLVTYLVPGSAGETAVGHRRLNLVWYDPQQRELLHEAGLLDGETVHGSLAPGARLIALGCPSFLPLLVAGVPTLYFLLSRPAHTSTESHRPR